MDRIEKRAMQLNDVAPVDLYGSGISYFTGKLEMYFRARGIDYALKPLSRGRVADEIMAQLGSHQMPALRLADGRWMSDSTAIIRWFETGFPAGGLIPRDPVLRFFSLLLEDYADEWLWRPAMHYRWHYAVGAHFAGQYLAQEVAAEWRAPVFLRRWLITQRQRRGYTVGDGITPAAVAGVEAIYHEALDALQQMLASRPFMLGASPSLVDVGFAGPMFRHFGLDPVPAEIMRRRAPAVWAWLGRLWDCASAAQGDWLASVPADWEPLLRSVGRAYLPYVNANAAAVAAGKRVFDAQVDGVGYRGARVSRYRVWCLAQLREAWHALPEPAQQQVRQRLGDCGAWEPLWEFEPLPMEPSLCAGLPFRVDAKMLEVYK